MILLGIHLITCCNSISSDNNKSSKAIVKSSSFENDSVECQDIIVKTLKIGVSKDKVEAFLGQPDSIKELIDSVDSPSLEYEVLFYDESELYFYKEKFFGFSLNSSRLDFNGIAVGGNISKVEKKYPKSFNKGLHKEYNEFVISCYGSCIYEGVKCRSPDRIIITYDENKVVKQIIAFPY